ncbi:stage V sporulation protein D (sporulation-specific penicillin-binding protein) [Croceifilum oryzae]|uniref:Stage V sporulation protein D (Sporulation-specific penicillin-binding protein) n=1 Tax=Croceifilum oryzae TaxID=1553429 RepID=A0AAJ1WSW8_9BACL|nr:stage V sporulation protein D [Croceifilum oryzae]MDQ0416381.1 stage V sporulation protein D (sporulation-specific penicillin-binding protein) [Croceifilum oryzae]
MRAIQAVVKKRLFVVLIIAVLVMITLIGRLSYVQLAQGEWWAQKAEELGSRDADFLAKRGMILDRDGKKIAYNISTPSVLLFPAMIKDKAGTAKKLAEVLAGDEKKILEFVSKKESKVWLKDIGQKIPESKAKILQEMQLPGVLITEDSKRYYPYGTMAAHMLGFTGGDNQGLAGLELIYDKQLSGQKGYISFASNAKGERMPDSKEEFISPKPGKDLRLTLDLDVQSIIERELDQAMAQYKPESVLAIAMDPNNGEILGMSSKPSFRPDEYQTTDPLIYNRNLPIWKTYEPGSTFKIITLAAALEEKKVNLTESFHDPGYVMVSGARLRCWKKGGHGHESFLEVVENSCNPGFVELGNRLGKTKLLDYVNRFGFGKKTGIDLNGEAKGILFKPERMGPVEQATTAFGQGVSVTPIQQVRAVSAAVNGGKMVVPHVMKEWTDPESGKVLESYQPKVESTVISEATSKIVRESLESVVAKGTGRKAFVDGYRVGGKTGTAQKVGPNGGYLPNNHIVSFIGFAPADDPKIVVYVAVDNPQGIQFGGVVAAPIVGNIIGDSLRHMEVPKRKNQIPPEDTPLTTPIVETPDLMGQELDKIRNSLFDFPLKPVGKGNVVIDQIPAPGERVKKGSSIQLYLGDKTEAGD